MKPQSSDRDDMEITFDKNGRMNYHPDFHARHKMPWTTHERSFIIKNYNLIGPEECSLTLERTMRSVMQFASRLRKDGYMEIPKKRGYFKRTINKKGVGGNE